MDVLPEGCIANVVSLTSSPRDACRLAVVCSTFKSMAESDAIWERFLPSQYKDIITRAVDFPNLTRSSSSSSSSSSSPPPPSSSSFASKKQLYLWLSDHPLLIDQGTKAENVVSSIQPTEASFDGGGRDNGFELDSRHLFWIHDSSSSIS